MSSTYRIHTRRLIAALALMSGLGLTACASTDQGEPSAEQSEAASEAAEEATTGAIDDLAEEAPAEDEFTEEPLEEEEEPALYAFGDSVSYDDGLELKVGKPVEFKPTEYASFRKKDRYFIKFPVTITNDTTTMHNAYDGWSTAQSGTREAEEVYDYDQDMGGFPDVKVLPGRTVKFWIGYGADKGQDFILSISPSFEHDETLYAS